MSLAAVFAFLLASGACGQSAFQGPDGQRLVVMVCPRVEPAGEPAPEPQDEAAPPRPERRT